MSDRKNPMYNKYKRALYPGRPPINQENVVQTDGSDTLFGEFDCNFS